MVLNGQVSGKGAESWRILMNRSICYGQKPIYYSWNCRCFILTSFKNQDFISFISLLWCQHLFKVCKIYSIVLQILHFKLLFLSASTNSIFIDREAREIVYLVASVRLSVCVLSCLKKSHYQSKVFVCVSVISGRMRIIARMRSISFYLIRFRYSNHQSLT